MMIKPATFTARRSAFSAFLGAFWQAFIIMGGCCLLSVSATAAEVDFSHDIVPLLKQHCGKCHTGDKREGAFSLNTRELLLAGGEDGPAAVAGKSAQSELIRRVTTDAKEERMPPEGARLSAEQVALLSRWIDEGAKWEAGFAFQKPAYDPPLKPRQVVLPPVIAGHTNPVDRIVDTYLATQKVPAPTAASDEVFLRRVYLDVVGLLPTPQQQAQFKADARTDKRAKLVEELLADDIAYAEHWFSFWNDLLRNDYTGTGFITGGRKQITPWLYQSLVSNKPYDQLVREIISPTPDSEGFIQGIRWRGEVNSSQTVEVQFAQNISQAFLGINMKCASCHDSFVDHWKLDEAYGLAAIYATAPLEINRCDKPTGKQAQAAWIFPELGKIDPAAPQPQRLQQLAALMTHPENGRLTRTIVNRLWHRLLGRGIVHPTDAMHTEPWSSDLLDFLAFDLAEHKYDLKRTLGLICSSHIYQAKMPTQAQPASAATYKFQGPVARRLTAEQFVDAVWQITGAGPTKADAAVNRVKLVSAAGDSAVGSATALPASGKWVWNIANASDAVPKAGEVLAFRRVVELPAAPTSAVGAITCDNSYKLFINGQAIQADENWETVEALSLDKAFRAGKNELLIVATNGGATPNPAGLYFETHLRFADGKSLSIATGNQWEWSAQLPDAKGIYATQPTDWKPAAVITNPAVWSNRSAPAIAAALAATDSSASHMVRASLMKSDYLMRSLGRPNRDQIVSMRPTDLTTLEAIDLANGQILADTLTQGAKHLLARKFASPEELTTWLYQSALARSPTASELASAVELLGPLPEENAVADLLWALLMLPEFQLVR